MRVFVTGATGFIGMQVTKELIAAGHEVLGLSRSEAKAPALAALGAEVCFGSIEDAPDQVASHAARADGVIHLAFVHEFSRFAEICAIDRRMIEAFGAVLAGSGKTLVMTSGTAMAVSVDGRPSTEDGPTLPPAVNPRGLSETTALALAASGLNVAVVRLPQVHDTRRQGLVSYAVAAARQHGSLAYVGAGQQRWPGAHVSDVARLYRLALEKAAPHAIYHAVAEEGVMIRDMFEAISRRTGIPSASIAVADAAAHYGPLAAFVDLDMPASGARTRAALGWDPVGPGMLDDLSRLELDPA